MSKKREDVVDCINALEKYQIKLEDSNMVWWICKALCLLLIEELKRENEDG